MTLLLFHIDRYAVSDLLFVSRFGRYLAAAPASAGPRVVVHDGHEEMTNVVENNGLDVSRLTTDDWSKVSGRVYNAVRDLNRRIVSDITEEGIPAVGLMAADRRLVSKTPDGLVCNRLDLLLQMSLTGGVPVVAPIVQSAAGEALVDSTAVMAALAARAREEKGVRCVSVAFDRHGKTTQGHSAITTVKSSTSPDTGKKGDHVMIRAENLAETEFWERFS